MMQSRLVRIAVALAVVFAVTVVGTGTVLAASVVTSGMVTVQVQEHGPDGADIYVPVPAGLINLGLGVARLAIPPEELAQMRREMEPFAPTLRQLSHELETMPDAVLVEVITDRDRVQVEKRGAHFIVDVQSADEANIHVTLPASTLSRAARLLTD